MNIFHLRRRSLVRGTFLALASFVAGFALSGFPALHPNPWLLLPLLHPH